MDADDWNTRYAGAELVWSSGPNRFVVEVVEPWTPGRAIDVACGEGRNAIWLAQQGWEVDALDFSQVAVDRARELAAAAGAAVDWHVADATTHRHAPAGADLVLVCYLQLPGAQLAEVLERAREALAPGGAVVVIAHALDNLAHGVGGPQDPAVLPTPDQVVGMLDGLRVERAGHVTRPVETGDEVRDAIDLVVVARRPD